MKIDLSKKISYQVFIDILANMGYIDKRATVYNNEHLVKLAWQMIKTRGRPSDVHTTGTKFTDEVNPYEEEPALEHSIRLRETTVDSVTFENFAMLLNLINNVYIKNNTPARSTNEVIDEEEDFGTGTMIVRPFGYADAQGRFMASSSAEVDMIYKKLYPLMANRRKNQTLKSKTP